MLSDIEFNLTKFSCYLAPLLWRECKGRGGICPKCPMLDPPMIFWFSKNLFSALVRHCIRSDSEHSLYRYILLGVNVPGAKYFFKSKLCFESRQKNDHATFLSNFIWGWRSRFAVSICWNWVHEASEQGHVFSNRYTSIRKLSFLPRSSIDPSGGFLIPCASRSSYNEIVEK